MILVFFRFFFWLRLYHNMAESVDSLQGFNTYVLLMWLCVPQSFQCMKLFCGSYILCILLVIPSCNITFHIIDIIVIIIIIFIFYYYYKYHHHHNIIITSVLFITTIEYGVTLTQ